MTYDPDEGTFEWNSYRSGVPKSKGKNAGTFNKGNGYIFIGIDYKSYTAHRLAWFYMTGNWPKDQIDHMDGNRTNNKFSNLREATPTQNSGNSRGNANTLTGRKGVTISAGKYTAQIQHKGKSYYLGRFTDLDEASAAYKKKADELFGEFAKGD